MSEDLISRQAAIDAIHNLYAIHGSEGSWIDQKDAFKALNSLPSAQPEIIRCKDCKHYYALNEVRGNCSEYNFVEKIPIDYCSWAERRTDD